MLVVFRAKVQAAIKNRLQTIALLMKAPWSEERDERIRDCLRMIDRLLILEPASLGRPSVRASKSLPNLGSAESFVGVPRDERNDASLGEFTRERPGNSHLRL